MSEDGSTTEPIAKPIRTTVSGRGFTFGVLLLLAVILGGGLPVLLRFHHLQSLLDDAKQKWPSAMAQWEPVYARMLEHLQELSADPASGVSASECATFREAFEGFRRYASRQDQLAYAIGLDRMFHAEKQRWLWEKDAKLSAMMKEAEDSVAMRDYLAAEKKLVSAENSSLGRLCRTILQLPPSDVLREVSQ